MPTVDEVQKQRDERFYERQRQFAGQKRRAENGRKPSPPVPVADLPVLLPADTPTPNPNGDEA